MSTKLPVSTSEPLPAYTATRRDRAVAGWLDPARRGPTTAAITGDRASSAAGYSPRSILDHAPRQTDAALEPDDAEHVGQANHRATEIARSEERRVGKE